MTAQYTQYRPVGTTRAENPIDVRSVRELAASINNYVRYVGNHKVISHLYLPPLQSTGVAGDPVAGAPDSVMQCPLFWLGAYSSVRWWATAKLTAGTAAGGDYTKWSIFLSRTLLSGSVFLDERVLSIVGSTTFNVTSENRAVYTGTFSVDYKDVYGPLICVLGSIDVEVAAAPRTELYSFDIQPIVV